MSDWKEFSLGDVADPNDRYSFSGGPFGSNLKSEEYTESGVRIIQLQNIGDGIFRDDYKIYTSEEKADELSSCNIYPGEIILSKMGDPVARAALIPDMDERYLMASDGIRLKVDQTRFDPTFVLSAINSPQFRGNAESVSVGSTRKRIGLTTLKGLTISAPPLPEQKKIAEILSGVDRSIGKSLEAISKMHTMLTGIFADLDLIASSGKTTPLGEIARVQNGYAFQSSDFSEDPADIPLVRISNISGGIIDVSKSKRIPRSLSSSDEYKVYRGDILIAMSGATTGKIGEYHGDGFCLLNQRVGKFVFFHEGDSAFYASRLLLSGFLESRILAKAAGGAQPNISGKGIEEIEIPFPGAADQEKFGSAIKELLLVSSKRKVLVEKYRNLKAALSADLLSGRKRVTL